MLIRGQLAILGPEAPKPILSSDNLTSTCWPITPKEHDLALIESHNETVSLFLMLKREERRY